MWSKHAQLEGIWNVRLPCLWNDKVFTSPKVIKDITQSSKIQPRFPTVLHFQEGVYGWRDRIWKGAISTSSGDKRIVLGRHVLPKRLRILPGCMCQVSKNRGFIPSSVFLNLFWYIYLRLFFGVLPIKFIYIYKYIPEPQHPYIYIYIAYIKAIIYINSLWYSSISWECHGLME